MVYPTFDIEIIKKSSPKFDQFYQRVFNRLKDNGIEVLQTFIFGSDTDDKSIFERALEFLNRHNITLAQFFIVTPFPRTPFYRQLEKEGRLLHKDWSKYNSGHVVFRPKNMTEEDLYNGYMWAWKEFYRTKKENHALPRSLA